MSIDVPHIVETNCLELSAGKFDSKNGSDSGKLETIFSDIASKRPQSLVIHFHGGLVSRASGIESAQRLAPEYKKADAESLFVIWETSAAEVIQQNLQKIWEEPIFQSILGRVTEFVRGKLEKAMGPSGGRGVSGLPRTLASDIQNELEQGTQGETMFAEFDIGNLPAETAPTPEQALSPQEKEYIENQVNRDGDIRKQVRAIVSSQGEPGSKGIDGVGGGKTTLMDETVLQEISPEESTVQDEQSRSILGAIAIGKRVVTVVGAVVWRYTNRRDHGAYLTIVEEILRAFYVRAAGRFLWTQMKDAVDKAFEDDQNSGGKALVEQFRKLWASGVKPCVTLVGHSAGGIYIGRFLREIQNKMPPDFRVNVLLIAPACTFDYFATLSIAREHELQIYASSE